MILPAPHLVVVSPKKRKEKKRNINNDLADLPSHDSKWKTPCPDEQIMRWG